MSDVSADSDVPVVIGLGELLWDVFPDSRRPGGAPANVAFQVNQLGCHGRVASRLRHASQTLNAHRRSQGAISWVFSKLCR